MTFWPSWKKEKGAFPGSDRLSLIGSWLYVLSYQRINYKASKVGNIKLHQPRSKAEFDGTLAWEITSPWSSSSSESNKALHGPLFRKDCCLYSAKKKAYMECMKWLESFWKSWSTMGIDSWCMKCIIRMVERNGIEMLSECVSIDHSTWQAWKGKGGQKKGHAKESSFTAPHSFSTFLQGTFRRSCPSQCRWQTPASTWCFHV